MRLVPTPGSDPSSFVERWRRLRPWFFWGWVGLLVLLAVMAAGRWYNQALLDRDADHLFESVLAGGNVAAIHRAADTQFQSNYPLEALEEYLRRRPALLQRERLTVLSVDWKRGMGAIYAVLKTRVADEQNPGEVTFYCSQNELGNWRLAGIGPDLKAGVPGRLTPVGGFSNSRK